jgi:hypothetical protein
MQTSAAVARKVRKEEEQERAAKKARAVQKKPKDEDIDKSTEETRPARVSQPVSAHYTDSDSDTLVKQTLSTKERPKEFTSFSASAPRRLNDVVQAPPELKRLPRGATAKVAVRGKPDGTKSLREGVLSMAQKAMMDQERERVVKAYREMKKRKPGE